MNLFAYEAGLTSLIIDHGASLTMEKRARATEYRYRIDGGITDSVIRQLECSDCGGGLLMNIYCT